MNISYRSTGTRKSISRFSLFAAILAGSMAMGCAPTSAQSSILGQWRTTTQMGTITISFMSNGQYDQTGVGTTGVQTMQAGPYQLVAPNSIIFTVATWSPHSRTVLVPCGIPNDPVCNVQRVVNYPQPPGTRYTYMFNGPNKMTLSNQTGPLTFTRVTGQ
ncbi:MAG TPA: hypothetical protein VGG45_05260 [Terracidiphilus sp.]|jgi:hypothetical protein